MTAIRKLTQQPNYLGDTPPPLSFKEWKARPSIDSGHTADLKFLSTCFGVFADARSEAECERAKENLGLATSWDGA